MRITHIRWGRTKSKNYQSDRAEVEINLEGSSLEVGLEEAKRQVDFMLGDTPSETEIEAAKGVLKRARR